MVTNKSVMELKIEKSNGNGSTNYLTHNFHAYPAKFIPQIPKSIIMKFTKEGKWFWIHFVAVEQHW